MFLLDDPSIHSKSAGQSDQVRATIFVAILYGIYSLGRTMIESQNIPLLPTILVTVLSLYFTTVQMRVLGILYFTNKGPVGLTFIHLCACAAMYRQCLYTYIL